MEIIFSHFSAIFAVLAIVSFQFSFSWESSEDYDRAFWDFLRGIAALAIFLIIEVASIIASV